MKCDPNNKTRQMALENDTTRFEGDMNVDDQGNTEGGHHPM
jgi:hypothetical protein